MGTTTKLTDEQLELLATLQTGLNAGEQLGVLNGDQANDLFSDCLTALDIDYNQYCELLEELC